MAVLHGHHGAGVLGGEREDGDVQEVALITLGACIMMARPKMQWSGGAELVGVASVVGEENARRRRLEAAPVDSLHGEEAGVEAVLLPPIVVLGGD